MNESWWARSGESVEDDPRRCAHVAIETSERCKAWASKKGGGLCAGHAGLGLVCNPQEASRRAAETLREQARVRRERRSRTYRDVLQDEFEAQAEEVVARLMDVIHNGTDSDALRAIEQISSRLYGRPKETVVNETPEPKTLADLRALTREQRRQLLLSLEKQRGGLSLVPAIAPELEPSSSGGLGGAPPRTSSEMPSSIPPCGSAAEQRASSPSKS